LLRANLSAIWSSQKLRLDNDLAYCPNGGDPLKRLAACSTPPAGASRCWGATEAIYGRRTLCDGVAFGRVARSFAQVRAQFLGEGCARGHWPQPPTAGAIRPVRSPRR